MKCALLIVSIALLSCGNAYAGTHGGGVKAGLLVSSPTGEDVDTYDVEPLNTFVFGAFYRYTFSQLLSLQVEALYAHKGATGTIYAIDGQANLWYLDFAPLLQCRVLDTSGFLSDLYAGPTVSMRMDASFESGAMGDDYWDISSGTKSYDYGYAIGAKLGLARGGNEACIDVRYSAGLVAPNDTGREIDLKHRTYTVMLELYF
jgi:Outer membrane protein beta-barrel domain